MRNKTWSMFSNDSERLSVKFVDSKSLFVKFMDSDSLSVALS